MNKLTILFLLLSIIISCSKTTPENAVVKIGKKVFSKSDYEMFNKITKMYPTDPGNFFPAFRSRTTQFVETELIYRKIPAAFRDSLKKTDDWKLKKQYYPAQLFLTDYLSVNLGCTEEEIVAFYKANKDSFKVTITNDSTKTDSTYFRELDDVRGQIVDDLFLQANKPDSQFLARFDSLADQKYINEQWLTNTRKTLPNFFMKKIYTEVHGKPFPDSVTELMGEGKYIDTTEFDAILNWIPETRRKLYDAPEPRKELVFWLVKWKLFSSYAHDNQVFDKITEQSALEWAWKLSTVYSYVTTVLAPKAKAAVVIDTTMLQYALYDDNGYAPFKKTDNGLISKLRSEERTQTLRNLERTIMNFRSSVPITFFQSDWTDIKNQKPDSLFKQAEIFRDSGKVNDAKNIFLTLTKEFSFSPQGLNAFIELAKLQTEQQLYSPAIDNYRKYLINSGAASDKRCNTFFMIGFIYDEYLNKPLHAENNYKWVLQNTPDCELADDAEFMMLHLNEPMSSVEELRDEATRQGRDVDETSEVPVEKPAQ